MPWKVHCLLEARQRFVQAAGRGIHSVAQLCRQFGISRKTGFKWLARFRSQGGPGLSDRSRRPHRAPRRTASRWLREIGRMRQRRPRWGAKKIYAHLRRKHPRAHLPKVRTIAKWLRRLGFIGRRRASARRGPQLVRPPLTVPSRPNHVWTVDFKGWFCTRDGQRVDPLTVRDLFSRYLLGIRLLHHNYEPVRQYFQQLFVQFGQPEIIRVDHGQPFAGDGALDLSRLSAWWLRLGIRVEFTAGLDLKTTRLMNRCIECIRPKRLRLRQPRRGASSNELRVLFATITMTVRTRRWSKECPQPFTERADAATEAGCPNCDTVELGLRAVSPKAVTYAGADESESLVEPSVASVWASSQSVPASMRFISGVILLAFWWTPIQEACVQLDGPVEWKQQLGRCLTKTAGAAEIASRPSGGSAARFGAGAPHRSAPPPEGRSPARN